MKTTRFADARYIGDPVNTCRIFNDKEVHELTLLDISATIKGTPPPMQLLRDLASECFMPLAYGGGLRDVESIRRILEIGLEKIVLNTAAVENPSLVEEVARELGSSSVVVSIDVRRRLLTGYEVVTRSGRGTTGLDPVAHARHMQDCGAGELLLTSVDREGTMKGYDLDLTQRVSKAVSIPVIANGGAGGVLHFQEAVGCGASAVAAGSMFVYQGRHRAVLVTYPDQQELKRVLR